MCAQRETKLKRKGEVMFDEVVGRVSGVAVGRAREGLALLLSGRLIIIIIIIILLKQDYKVQLANNKIQMSWLTSWLVVR